MVERLVANEKVEEANTYAINTALAVTARRKILVYDGAYHGAWIHGGLEKSTHNRRVAFSYLRSKEAVAHLFSEVSEKVADRQGGYTRIIKLGNRLGDSADMALIELVDFNETYNSTEKKAKSTRRSRRSKSAETKEAAPAVEEVAVAEAPAVEEAAPEVDTTEESTDEETK